MASKAAGGLVLLGIGALLFASSSGASEKKSEPAPPGPGPGPLPAARCVRTQPGDGKGNGKEAAVRAWQKCLVESGCLASDAIDGQHGPITEGASKLYEATGGKCDDPYQPPKGGGGGGKPAIADQSVSFSLERFDASKQSNDVLEFVVYKKKPSAAQETKAVDSLKAKALAASATVPGTYAIGREDLKGKKGVWSEYLGAPPQNPDDSQGMNA